MKDIDTALVQDYVNGILILRTAVNAMYESWQDIVYGRKEDYLLLFENTYNKCGMITGHTMQRGSVKYTLDIEKDIYYVKDLANECFTMSMDSQNKITIKSKKKKLIHK